MSTARQKTVIISKVEVIQSWNFARMSQMYGYEKWKKMCHQKKCEREVTDNLPIGVADSATGVADSATPNIR